MRHFQLLRFLAFTTSPDSLHSPHVALQQSPQQQNHQFPTSGATSLVRKLSSAVESHTKIVQAAAAEQEEQQTTTRRRALQSIFAAAGGSVAFVAASNALDMDAFMNAELESDTKNCDPKKDPKCKPKLSEDEALCQYGQSGNARGEACKRFKAAGGKLPTPGSQGRSLGGAYAM